MLNKDILKLYKIPLLDQNFIVYYSSNFDNLYKQLNKKKNKEISNWLKKQTNNFQCPSGSGGLLFDNETKKPFIIFIKKLKSFDDLILIHENCHLIDCLACFYGFEKEMEFKAYLSEKLFKDIKNLCLTK